MVGYNPDDVEIPVKSRLNRLNIEGAIPVQGSIHVKNLS